MATMNFACPVQHTDSGTSAKTAVYYVKGPTTDTTAGTWTGTITGLGAYFDGLTVLYRPNVAGASTTTLNINSLGAKTCYVSGTTKLTTHYAVGSIIRLTYYNGGWHGADYWNSNTKNTAGSTDTSEKIFLVGATTQAASPQTYSHDTAYVGTNGHLYSNSVQVVNLSDTQALTNKTYNGYTLAAACAKSVTDNSSSKAVTSSDTNLITGRTLYYAGYTKNAGTVTSVRVQATSPVASSTSTAQTGTLDTTISLADGYGDTKNPYATKTANYVLAGPTSGNAAAPSFRQLVAADIPSLTKSKISDFPSSMTPSSHTHGNLTNDGKITTTATIASGDKLVIVDSDTTAASKITGSSITFGTSTTKCLTEKGTWAAFTNNAGTITGVSLNGTSVATSGTAALTGVVTGNTEVYYGTCATAAATAEKVVVCATFPTSPAAGTILIVNFTNNNTVASPTLKITSDGSVPLFPSTDSIAIYRYGTTVPSSSAKTSWNAGMVSFVYNGSTWCMIGWLNDDTTSTVNQGAALANTNTSKYTLLHAQNTGTSARNGYAVYKSTATYQPSTQDIFIHDKPALYGTYSSTAPASPVTGQIWLKQADMSVSEAKVLVVSASTSSLPTTISNSNITADMVCVNTVISPVAAQKSDWSVETAAGTATISGTISGTASITLYLARAR